MSSFALSEQDWQIRLYIFQYIVDRSTAPSCEETAQHFNLSPDEARLAYHRLNDHHRIFLKPGTDDVMMAHPLSAVPTPYKVYIKGRQLWANCGMDSLGIPALLQADARIEATILRTGEVITYAIENGGLKADGGFVHFPLPVRQWYDDLIHT